MDFRAEEGVDNGFWKKWGALLLLAGLISAATGIPAGLRESTERKLLIVGALIDHQEQRHHNKAVTTHQPLPFNSIHLPKKSPMMKMGVAGILSAGLGVWILLAARKREYDSALRTPERERRRFIVSLPEYRHATVWRRICATCLDGVTLGVPLTVTDFLGDSSVPFYALLGLFVSSCIANLYAIILLGIRGQTIGKWLCRVKVLNQRESKLTMRQAFLRNSVPLALALSYLGVEAASKFGLVGHGTLLRRGPLTTALLLGWGWYLADFITMLVAQKRRAIHDFIAHSVVVRCAD